MAFVLLAFLKARYKEQLRKPREDEPPPAPECGFPFRITSQAE